MKIEIIFTFFILILYLSFLTYQVYDIKNKYIQLNIDQTELQKNLTELQNNLKQKIKKINENIDNILIIIHNITYKLNDLNKKIISIKEKQNGLIKNLNKLNIEMEHFDKLNENKIKEIYSKINMIEHNFSTKLNEFQKIFNSLIKTKNLIENRIEWIKTNSKINKNIYYNIFSEIENNCLKDKTLNLPCVWFVLHKINGIKYIYDQEGDFLSSINSTLEQKGGDCEDLSLLFAAVIRSINFNNIKFLYEKNGTNSFVYKGWYIKNVDYKQLNGYNKVYVVCGENFKNEGHCVNAFCNKYFNKKESISSFIKDSCVLLDPQTYCTKTKFKKIYFVITSNDLCINYKKSYVCFSDWVN